MVEVVGKIVRVEEWEVQGIENKCSLATAWHYFSPSLPSSFSFIQPLPFPSPKKNTKTKLHLHNNNNPASTTTPIRTRRRYLLRHARKPRQLPQRHLCRVFLGLPRVLAVVPEARAVGGGGDGNGGGPGCAAAWGVGVRGGVSWFGW